MGERSLLLDVLTVVLLGLLCLLGIFIIKQYDTTQESIIRMQQNIELMVNKNTQTNDKLDKAFSKLDAGIRQLADKPITINNNSYFSTPAGVSGVNPNGMPSSSGHNDASQNQGAQTDKPGAQTFNAHGPEEALITEKNGTRYYLDYPIHAGPDGEDEIMMGGLRVRVHPYRNPVATPGGILRGNLGTDPPGLNPYVSSDAAGSAIFSRCNDSFASRDFDDLERWEPGLATHWDIRQEIRIHLVGVADANAIVNRVKEAVGKPLPWNEYDITDIQPGDGVVTLISDSVKNRYESLINAQFKDVLTAVHYIYAEVNGNYAGDNPAKLEDVLKTMKQAAGPWTWIDGRLQTDHQSVVFVITGDQDAFRDAVNAALAPNAADDPKKWRGRVTIIDDRQAEIRPSVTFHLRRGVHWHQVPDLRPDRKGRLTPEADFNAQDVVFTWKKVLTNPEIPCDSIRNYYNDLMDVVALDDYTVRFNWFRPYFLLFSNSAGFSVLPRHIFSELTATEFIDSPFNRSVVGTGPWKFKVWKKGEKLELVRNDDYWGQRPYLNTLSYMFLMNSAKEMSMFKDRRLDIISATPEQWVQEKDKPAMLAIAKTDDTIRNSYFYIGYNARLPLFNDRRVRVAMTMLVNRDEIIRDIFNGTAVPLTGPFHINSPYYNHDLKPLPYNVAAAKALLADAGWEDTDGDGVLDKDDVPFKYEFMIPSGIPTYEQLATLVQRSDQEAGISVTIKAVEWATFINFVNTLNFQALSMGWALGYESDPYQLWHSSQAIPEGSNFVGFKNDEADEIIVKGRYTLDPDARKTMYRRLHAIIYHEQPYTFLYIPRGRTFYSKRFQDYKVTMFGTDYNRIFVKPADRLKP